MSTTPNLDTMREVVGRLHALLQDAEPGLMAWRQMVTTRVEETHALLTVYVEGWRGVAVPETGPGSQRQHRGVE